MQYPEDAIHDESYLHVMHEHIDPFIHNHNHAHTVYTRPADAPPKFDFLAVKNYLGEFKSDIDKARARFNLGIPDEFSFNWGNLTGNIEEQEDLIELINRKTLDLLSWKDLLSSVISGINDKISNNHRDVLSEIGLLSNKVDSKANSSVIGIIEDKVNNNTTEINKLWTDVADNSREIANLYKLLSGGEIDTTLLSLVNLNKQNIETLQNKLVNFDVLSINSRISALENRPTVDSSIVSRIAALENEVFQEHPLIPTNIEERLSTLEMAIRTNSLSLLYIPSGNTILVTKTDGDDSQKIHIWAKYTKIDDVEVTSECTWNSSNTSVATWDAINEKILIHSVGTSIITFSFRSKSISVTVAVSGNEPIPEVIPSYIGFAMTYLEVFTEDTCKINKSLIDGTYLNITEVTSAPYYLWIITPSVINTFKENNMWEYEVPGDNVVLTGATINGVNYNIYKFRGDGLFGDPDTLSNPTSVTITTK